MGITAMLHGKSLQVYDNNDVIMISVPGLQVLKSLFLEPNSSNRKSKRNLLPLKAVKVILSIKWIWMFKIRLNNCRKTF